MRPQKQRHLESPGASKGVTHPYLARALMADLDLMGYMRVILKLDQEPSIVALCDAVPGDVSTDLHEPMLIIQQLPDVDPAPTRTYHSDTKSNPQGPHP